MTPVFPGARRGFTLIELMLALALMTASFAIAYGAFAATARAWQRGTEAADTLNQGDLVMERLVAALRSAAFFPGEGDRYGFRLEDDGFDPPSARIGWVTNGVSFLPSDAPLAASLHRVEIALDLETHNEPVLIQRAWAYMVEEPLEDHVDTRVIARGMAGFRVRVFDEEMEDWTDEWSGAEGTLPRRLEIALLWPPENPRDEPIEIRRMVEIPLAPLSTARGAVPGRTQP